MADIVFHTEKSDNTSMKSGILESWNLESCNTGNTCKEKLLKRIIITEKSFARIALSTIYLDLNLDDLMSFANS